MGILSDNQNIDINALSSNSEIEILATLHLIKDLGNIDHLTAVINLISTTQSKVISKLSLEIARTIKDKQAARIILSHIEDKKYTTVKKQLVALCWENDFDLQNELDLFINIFATDPLEIAIEAYTVVSENIMNVTEEQKNRYTALLNNLAVNVPADRIMFFEDCLSALNE